MRIIAVPCVAGDLRPGDLWSSVGPEFWDQAHLGELDEQGHRAVGVKVYIRTEAQPDVMATNLTQVYRLHIVPTDIEQAISTETLRSIAELDTHDPIDQDLEHGRYIDGRWVPWDQPNLEVVPDEQDDLEHE